MDDGSTDDFDVLHKQIIDHERRKGGAYEPKAALTEEQRLRRSDRMKEYHRKTGKGTALGNTRKRFTRGPH